MIDRRQEAFRQDNDDKPVIRDDASDSRSRNASEARQRMLARVAGRTFSPPAGAAYREDSGDKLAWYRDQLKREGYTDSAIERMFKCPA
jgi:hypothetical protein